MSALEQPQQQQSLYRRHRPRSFAEVVGQEAVVRTLRHAVERNKVHHAYLFVGSRGTGKTSMAKILAACLNCESGPTVQPCGQCESCLSIARASSLDVIEMDAASNNSVDDIRELRESVAYAPVSGRRKVYILDEAHMLSTAAWNAFLKTLEEPPPNTLFVLATTEAQKVPATVVDRCHRFDFQRPAVEQIASVLARTAEAESIEIPPEALAALARSATGSFRDALGTLEQLVTYSGSRIALEDVLAVLGVADGRLLEETIDAVAAGDAGRALKALEQCVAQGRDAGALIADLEVRARELLVVQALGEVTPDLSLTPEADAALDAQAKRVDQAAVVRLLELLGTAMEAVRAGADPRTRLELALVKAARPEVDASTRALLARIERLERSGAGGDAPALAAVPAPAPQSAPTASTPAASTPASAPARQGAPASQSQSAPAPADPAPLSDPQDAARAPDRGDPTQASGARDPGHPEPAAGEEGPVAVAAVDADAEQPGAPRIVASRGQPEGAGPGGADLPTLLSLWPAVVGLVREQNGMLGALIEAAQPVTADGEELTVAFPASVPFWKKKAEDPANRAIVSAALNDISGTRWRLSYELREGLEGGGSSGQAPRSEEEWVRRLVEEFDAEEVGGEPVSVSGGAGEQRPPGGAGDGDSENGGE